MPPLLKIGIGSANAGEVDHRAGDLTLRPLEARRRHALAQRDLEDVQKVLDHADVHAHPARPLGDADLRVEHGVQQQPGLDQIRLPDGEGLIRRLQILVVQQRHMHRRVGRELMGEQGVHLRVGRGVVGGAAVPLDGLRQAVADELFDIREAAVLRDGRAAADGETGQRQGGDEGAGADHSAPPCGRVADAGPPMPMPFMPVI